MNYASLVASKLIPDSIRAWVNWDVAPAESILAEAQAFIYSKLQVSQMELLDTGAIVEGTHALELPADYMAAKSFRRTGETSGPIHVLDRAHFEERLQLDTDNSYFKDAPTLCAIYGDPATAYFNVEADDDYPYRLLYYARPPDLSNANQANWLTRDYPMLLRSACLFSAFRHRKEFTAAKEWQADLIGLIASCNGDGDQTQQINRTENYWQT